MTAFFQSFGIIGAGAWGTALAAALRRANRDVTLWARTPQLANNMNATHQNKIRLPDIVLDPAIRATASLKDLAGCDAWILATPAQAVRETCRALRAAAPDSIAPVIIAAKGIEQGTASLMSEVAGAELPSHPVAILSGPSFADEVASGKPCALTLAIANTVLGEKLMQDMASSTFRLYLTGDIVGAQIGGAVKNVMAVAAGIVAGRNMGENARAAIITRGLAEMMRLAAALGGRSETLMGLSGLGDLVLTCSSPQSRNMSLGFALGQGKKLKEILATRSGITEGVYTAAAAHALAQRHGIDMPIVAAVDDVLNRNADLDATIAALLARPLKIETA
jgi:glycerol-3-phosphate dehydrogenase (NAD(P)+)